VRRRTLKQPLYSALVGLVEMLNPFGILSSDIGSSQCVLIPALDEN
jgi:hypothetical protein